MLSKSAGEEVNGHARGQQSAPALPARGDFGGATLAGARSVLASQFADDSAILGLRREGTYVWGSLRDDRDDLVSHMRRIPPAGSLTGATVATSLGPRLVVLSTTGADALTVRPEARSAASSDDVTRSLDGDTVVFDAHAPGRTGMRLSTDGEQLAYREDGILELTGTRVGPGLQWYLPGATGALYYPTQTWLVEGTAMERQVRGFLFIEEAYMRPGGRLYVELDPLHDVRYLTWYSWATRWDDGDLEFGHFLYGNGRFHVGLVANSAGDVRVATSMDVTVRRSAGGYWHEGIELTMDGERWELVSDPRGRMQLGPIPNPQQEGLMRRVGEMRVPDVWMAWGETVPGNGDGRSR